MRKLRIMSALLAGVLTASMAFTGCAPKDSGTNGSSTGAGKDKEMVELNFYMSNSPVTDLDRIMKKANEIIGKEINAKLNLIMIDGANYAQKMNLMITSGDAYDLCFTANWGGINFFENAAEGAYADLTELLPKLAPESYKRIPQGLWEGVKVNGKIYGVVNYQQWGVAQRKGFKFRSDLADEVKFDWKAIKNKPTIEALKLIDPFIGASLKKHPGMIGWETSSGYSAFANEPLLWDMEAVGDMTGPGWVRFSEPTKVINQFDTKEFADYCDIMRDWYKKGYVRKDGATVKDTSPDRKAAKMIAEVSYGWPDTIDFAENADGAKMSMCTPDIAPSYNVSTTRTVIPAAAASTAAVAINAKSPNIEKAVELIELLNTNDELYMLITQGEEGVDYVYKEDGTAELVAGKYNFNFAEWEIGQSYSPTFSRALYSKNDAGKKQQESQTIVYEADKTAEISPVTGFTFDPEKVKTQSANCTSILTELIPALSSGSVDPKKAVPELLQRLKSAGVDDIIKEKQTQLDAWKASK